MKQITLIFLAYLVGACMLTSCNKQICKEPSECGNLLIISESQYDDTDMTGIIIDSISHQGNCLSMVVGFSGCDDDHDFSLIHDGAVAESYPVQISLAVRDNDPQLCEAFFTKKVFFDLKVENSVFLQEDKVWIHFKDKSDVDAYLWEK